MMDERTSRIFIGLCLLVVVWIGVYWMWQPSSDQNSPVITFEQPEQVDPPAITRSGDTTEENQDPNTEQGSLVGQLTTQREQAEPPPTEPKGPILKQPEFFEHIVAKSETMQTISRRYFGSPDKWDVIARANPFVDPQQLREGMAIRIPKDPDNIQGIVEGRDTEPGVIESHTPNPSAVIEYVVRPGDSLSKISLNIYGSTRHARFIYDSNRDVLRSMDDISIGQLLRLPPLPED